ncbi:MAG: hypothetical protein ACFFDW_15035 [Candidatus Thorarchaeota archaeon]
MRESFPTLIILSIIATLISLVLSVTSFIYPIVNYITYSLIAINILLTVLLIHKYAKTSKRLSKKWVAIEFQKRSIKIIYYERYFANQHLAKITNISDVAEFEYGFTKGIRKDKLITYLTITMKNKDKYYLGEIYNHFIGGEKFKEYFSNFVGNYYKIPIVNADTKY